MSELQAQAPLQRPSHTPNWGPHGDVRGCVKLHLAVSDCVWLCHIVFGCIRSPLSRRMAWALQAVPIG